MPLPGPFLPLMMTGGAMVGALTGGLGDAAAQMYEMRFSKKVRRGHREYDSKRAWKSGVLPGIAGGVALGAVTWLLIPTPHSGYLGGFETGEWARVLNRNFFVTHGVHDVVLTALVLPGISKLRTGNPHFKAAVLPTMAWRVPMHLVDQFVFPASFLTEIGTYAVLSHALENALEEDAACLQASAASQSQAQHGEAACLVSPSAALHTESERRRSTRKRRAHRQHQRKEEATPQEQAEESSTGKTAQASAPVSSAEQTHAAAEEAKGTANLTSFAARS